MFGNNHKRSPIFDNGQMLQVKKIFKTLQGEGIFIGMPSIFIRLGGCNLACKFCDTDFEDFQEIILGEVLNKVKQLSYNSANNKIIQLIVITGGEPLRQNIAPLCQELLAQGYIVQIETNGTLYRELPNDVYIICSPKSSNGTYKRINEFLLPKLNAIKFLVSKNLVGYSTLAEIGQSDYNIPVFVQPIDENNSLSNHHNTEFAIKLAIEGGYRLSIQLHKILGIE